MKKLALHNKGVIGKQLKDMTFSVVNKAEKLYFLFGVQMANI